MLRNCFALSLVAAIGLAQPTIVKTTTLIDGKGGVLRNQEIVIDSGRITRMGVAKQKPTIDLSGLTVMPGWIDTHVHLGWYFDKEGRYDPGGPGSKTTPREDALYSAANAYRTLMGGFTTVQCLGQPIEGEIRDLVAAGALPGPRVITSLRSVNETTGGPAEIRAYVDKMKADGADVIKLFATASIRDGGKMTMSVDQINAACGEARKLGLRSAVHAHAPDGARAAIEAGCTSIEHGTFLDDSTLGLMAARGTFFDPNFLVLHNYLENKPRYLGIGNYTEDGFAAMEKGCRWRPTFSSGRAICTSRSCWAPTRLPARTGAMPRSSFTA